METKIKELLKKKGDEVWSIGPDATVFEGLKLMAAKNIGAVIVTEGNELVGIFSERDYARNAIIVGKAPKEIKISELMTKNVIAVKPEATVQECLGLFTERRIRHLPVVDNNKVVGMLTIGDAVKHVIADLQYTVRDLENYITGGGYGA